MVTVGVSLAENPAEPPDDSLGDEVEPATWRKISLRVDKETNGRADVVLLRPQWWIDERVGTDGATLSLSVSEIGIHGEAEVLAIEPCPQLAAGTGRVVIGTFAHWSPDSIELHVEGLAEPIRCTPDHATWSHDRQKFLRACELTPGERVQGVGGLHRVVAIRYVDEPIRVYNLEVHRQHVYQVSPLGVLVHNPGGGGSGGSDMPSTGDLPPAWDKPWWDEDNIFSDLRDWDKRHWPIDTGSFPMDDLIGGSSGSSASDFLK